MQVAPYFWTQTMRRVLVEFSRGLSHK